MPNSTDEKLASTKESSCSFCGKAHDQVAKLIAGPGVYVCNECVGLCNEILEEANLSEPRNHNGMFLSRGPWSADFPHAFKNLPSAQIDSAIDTMQCLIEAHRAEGVQGNAEPLFLVLLALHECKFGTSSVELLPTLEVLETSYTAAGDAKNALQALTWMKEIINSSAPAGFDKRALLAKLAKVHMHLGNDKLAAEIIDQLSKGAD